MRIILTIVASHDRDPSCNDFTLTKEFEYRLSAPPTANDVRERAREVIVEFGESYPHKGRISSAPVLDASIRQVDRS